MFASRLTPLDASFLAVESPVAHMHVGWIAVFDPPAEGGRPTFDDLREHVAQRLDRAPRFRQRLKEVPFGLSPPSWVDDDRFDLDRHLRHARSRRLHDIVEQCMSAPLDRSRPLWQLWIADRLDDGRLAVIGKAHHSMVDGIAAVELASVLLDPEPDPPAPPPSLWRPERSPGPLDLTGRAIIGRTLERLRFAGGPLVRAVKTPRRMADLPAGVRSLSRAAVDAVRPAERSTPLNAPLSSRRHVGLARRQFDELKGIARAFEATINDVLLAVSAGAVRRHLLRHGEAHERLKAMVPVNLRVEDEEGELGNRISFMFLDLPCGEADAARRLRLAQAEAAERKEAHAAEGGDVLLRAAGQLLYPVHRAVSRLIASPRAFDLVVSNIPGPREPLYMRGCLLEEAFPIVPLADRHSLAIGMTTVRDKACFGLYADRHRLPDVEELARDFERAIDELREAGDRTVGDDARGRVPPVFA